MKNLFRAPVITNTLLAIIAVELGLIILKLQEKPKESSEQ